jgi:hypothetical protein
MTGESNIPLEYIHAKAVADGFLSQQEYDPKEVYTFLIALEGAPDITNIRFENKSQFGITAVKAEYTGDKHWEVEPTPQDNLACAELNETSRSIFGAIAEYTGFDITNPRATPQGFKTPPNCRADFDIGRKNLTMIITQAEKS